MKRLGTTALLLTVLLSVFLFSGCGNNVDKKVKSSSVSASGNRITITRTSGESGAILLNEATQFIVTLTRIDGLKLTFPPAPANSTSNTFGIFSASSGKLETVSEQGELTEGGTLTFLLAVDEKSASAQALFTGTTEGLVTFTVSVEDVFAELQVNVVAPSE